MSYGRKSGKWAMVVFFFPADDENCWRWQRGNVMLSPCIAGDVRCYCGMTISNSVVVVCHGLFAGDAWTGTCSCCRV